MPVRLAQVSEGSTVLYVPAESVGSKAPKTFPAFFNPAGRVNRDVSVAIAKATRPATFLDAMAGVGARGVRVANELASGVEVTLVEFNRASAEIAEKNAKKNGVATRCSIVHQETNSFLHSRFGRAERFEAVDVDPFGTPAPYVLGAINAAADGAIVSVTATDTATLCGVYPSVAYRRYGSRVHKSEFASEAAIRVLIGFCARLGGSVDAGIQPVAAHSTLHYVRAYFRVARGAVRSDRALREVGFVASCESCHENTVVEEYSTRCPSCGGRSTCIGPQWTGKLVEESVVREAARSSSDSGWDEAAKAMDALEDSEDLPPFGFSLEAITSRERLSSVKFQRVVAALEASGRVAMRQPFGTGLKTNASYSEVVEAVRRAWARPRGVQR